MDWHGLCIVTEVCKHLKVVSSFTPSNYTNMVLLANNASMTLFMAALCLLLSARMLAARPRMTPPPRSAPTPSTNGGVFVVNLDVSLFSYNSNLMIRGNHDGSVTADGRNGGTQ